MSTFVHLTFLGAVIGPFVRVRVVVLLLQVALRGGFQRALDVTLRHGRLTQLLCQQKSRRAVTDYNVQTHTNVTRRTE